MTPEDHDFDHLQKLHIDGRTSWCELPELGKDAALMLRPANESNKPYYAAFRKAQARAKQTAGSNPTQFVQDMADAREAADKVLFPKHVVIGWRGLNKADGTPAEFSPAKCETLFSKLPPYLLDRIRGHAMIPANFLPEGEEPINATELAKN